VEKLRQGKQVKGKMEKKLLSRPVEEGEGLLDERRARYNSQTTRAEKKKRRGENRDVRKQTLSASDKIFKGGFCTAGSIRDGEKIRSPGLKDGPCLLAVRREEKGNAQFEVKKNRNRDLLRQVGSMG